MASSAGHPAVRRHAFLSLIAVVCVALPLRAQRGGAVSLRIRPVVGDTLYTRFEQEVEMVGSTRVGNADTTLSVHTSMVMLSHVLVQDANEDGTIVTTVTDSVAIVASGGRAGAPSEATRRAMEGKQVRMRITPEGSATILDTADELTPDLQAVISQMPATLPSEPVPVGGSWSQVTTIPLAGQAPGDAGAVLHTTYQLDSVSRDGDIAYISMRGTLSRDSTAGALPQGIKLTSTGSLAGSMRVDRKRGWWTESRATISVRSVLTPPDGVAANPVHFQMRITQHMLASDEP